MLPGAASRVARAMATDQTPAESDWVFALKYRLKRHRRLATAIFYLTDLLYVNTRERKRFVAGFAPGARLLNLGAGFRESPRGFVPVDREPYPGIRLVADVTALPCADASIDGILLDAVLEHVPDVGGALGEVRRVLKPGGRLYVTVPFLWPYHASPHDYRRWTVSGVQRDLGDFEMLRVGLAAGPTTALVNVLHEWLAMLLSLNIEPLYRLLYLALVPVLFPLKALDLVLSHHRHAGKIGACWYVHGRKTPLAQARLA
jgi:SAM-dependent methyltransferase